MTIEGNASKTCIHHSTKYLAIIRLLLNNFKVNLKQKALKSKLLLSIVFIRKWIFNTNIKVVVCLLQNEVGLEVDTLVVSKLSLDNSY